MRPTVHSLHHADTGTWSYVIADPATRVAAIVDPVLDFDAKSARVANTSARKLLDVVEQHAYDVRWLLETHAHADHLSAAQWLKQELPAATLAIGAGIRNVQETFASRLDPDGVLATDGSQFDRLFGDGERFEVGSLPARTIPVPGHTRDSLAYLIGDALFTGDSLFMPDAGTARCDFPGGREAACETTIGEQKRSNLHVRDGVDEDTFVTLRKARDATLSVPALILPALQVNLRGGALPEPEGNGVRYLKLPLNQL